MDIANLEPGKKYVFYTKPWQPPVGEVIQGEAKERMFIGQRNEGAAGMPKVPFVEVARGNGTQHLIAVEAIDRIEPAVFAN